ncbi:MAG: hypothetical protein ABSF10_14445 [Verrucomicrobiota bacterium]
MNGRPPLPANADTLDSGSRSAPHRAAQFMADRDGGLPVWVRAPKRGHEFYSGCSRAKLYEWAAKGFIRSVSIREPGRIKGVRLFHLASILAFIEQCEVEAKSNQKDSLADTKPMTLPSLSTSAPPEP